ncbi:MAG: apolipoprotein N-acyltransferase [Flavobacteriales bacterium]|jgi:apolipoprotein N-acyltransferase|nr:apolipoprotein N-acyltransferase [Flavobacteriales bacterium]
MALTRAHIALWAALSGVLWALAWPAIGGLSLLAFVAWLPLLHAERLHDKRLVGRRRAFTPYALLALLVWNASCSWWFFGVSEPIGTRLVSGLAPMVLNALFMLVPWWLKRLTRRIAGANLAAIAFIAYWLAFERLHHDWDLKWPWFSIGNVLGTRPQWIQWYEYTGMLGGSAWVLLVTLFLDRAVVRARRDRRTAWANATVAFILLLLPITGSLIRFTTIDEADSDQVEVVVVQPNIDPYSEKFGGLDAMAQLDRMLGLAEAAMTDSTALVVMPETALQETATLDLSGDEPRYTGLWEDHIDRSRSMVRLREFQQRHRRAALLTGMSSDKLLLPGEPRPTAARPLFREEGLPPGAQRWFTSYNAALFLPSKGPVEIYHKSKLVAGVELMPFEEVLGYLGDLAIDLGGTSGSLGVQEDREVLVDDASGLRVVPAICYESVFGEHVAAHVRNGGNLIAVITNDGWWGDSPGYHQHLTYSSIRAIETRRQVVRSANTGISCFVDHRGVIQQPTAWWVPTAERRTVQLRDGITFFVQHGDLIGRLAVSLTGLLFVYLLVMRFRKPVLEHSR